MGTLQVMILGVSRYDFEDQKTKNQLKGCTVHYVQLSHANESDKMGYFPAKATIDYKMYDAFQGLKFPLQAEASWSMDLSNKRNPIKVTGFTDLQNILID